jgi:hypothetical protein
MPVSTLCKPLHIVGEDLTRYTALFKPAFVIGRINLQKMQGYASENWQEQSPKGSLLSNPNPLNVSCRTAIRKGEITPLVRLTFLN